MARFLLAALTLWFAAPTARAYEPVSFRNEVMAVLSRAGCNQGVCHGNLNGKGGFKLSLRGFDPDFDFASITRDALGRRANRQRPEDSLILQKPAGLGTALDGDTSFLNAADPRLSQPFLVGFNDATVTVFWVSLVVVLIEDVKGQLDLSKVEQ